MSALIVAVKLEGSSSPSPPERLKSGKSERDDVDAGTQVDDLVLSWPSLVTVRTFSIRTSLAASTVTPGRTAPTRP